MSRERIERLDRKFAELHRERCAVAVHAGDDWIYGTLEYERLWPRSAGALLIRSAAAVEQMINGITVRLWDDPFEWTLPERLPGVDDLIVYFDEVETARKKGFQFLRNDSDLERSIPAPLELKTLEQVLIDTFTVSQTYLSEARSLFSNLTNTK